MDLRIVREVDSLGCGVLLVEEGEGGDQINIQVLNLGVCVGVGLFMEEKNLLGEVGLGENYLGLLGLEYWEF